jgi:hypothetical protein
LTAGASGVGYLTYSGITRNAGQLYGGTTDPASTTRLNYDGNLHANQMTAVDFNSISDERYKKDIEPIIDGLAIVNQINPVSYLWKHNEKKAFGVIAQELEKIIPEVVQNTDDKRTVSYDQLIPFIIQAIKQLDEKIKNDK